MESRIPKAIVIFLGTLLIVEIAIMYFLFFNIQHNVEMQNPEPIIKERSDNVLQEFKGTCPLCGDVSYGINGNIVCRNENCPNYGLAVPVEE